MKTIRIIFTVITGSFLVVAEAAQEEYSYSKLFEDDKVWNIVDKYYNWETDETTEVHSQVSINREWDNDGHIMTEVKSFNIENNTSSLISYLEEDKKIYTKISKTELQCIIDFNLRMGDPVPIKEAGNPSGDVLWYNYVVNDQILDIKGIGRRVVSIGDEQDDQYPSYWIEGIGSIYNYTMLVYPVPICGTYLKSRHIISCFQNGECIFDLEEFESEYISRNSNIITVNNKSSNSNYLSYSNDSITVNGLGDSDSITINIYSFDGVMLISERLFINKTLSISNLPSGKYIARVTSADGSCAFMKFLK